MKLDARETRLRAEALLRRRRTVDAQDVVTELGGADVSELRRFLLVKLRADDLEEDEVPKLVLVATWSGLGPIRKDVQAIADDGSRPDVARDAALRMLS